MSFYGIEQQKTVVEIKNVWPPLMYIIPADSAIETEQARVRYLFQYKRSDHLVSLTLDLEEASQTQNYSQIDVDDLKERDECTVIDSRPIHASGMDY